MVRKHDCDDANEVERQTLGIAEPSMGVKDKWTEKGQMEIRD